MNHHSAARVLLRADFQRLVDALRANGLRVVAPVRRDEAIVYGEIERTEELPIGWTDEQEAAHYRLKRRSDQALFGYVVGPHSWKKFLNPTVRRLWSADREGGGFRVSPETEETPRYAFLGVRACELRAMEIQDKVFASGDYPDPLYVARRQAAFIVAVNCGQAGGTCFCSSMNAGPKAKSGYDLALTELLDAAGHRFLVEAGSAAGEALMAALPLLSAEEADLLAAREAVERAERQMGRTMPCSPEELKSVVLANPEHPRWDDVASRCLACANCTMACPTCFCSTVEDVTDLSGDHAERWLRQDSCFTLDFSYMRGGSARTSTKARYRQWLTHKLGTWFDQFGESGCVGCGRCVTWCPAAIDIVAEARALRGDPPAVPSTTTEPNVP